MPTKLSGMLIVFMVKVSVNPSQAALLCKLAEEGRLDYVGLFIMADGWTVAQKNLPHHCSTVAGMKRPLLDLVYCSTQPILVRLSGNWSGGTGLTKDIVMWSLAGTIPALLSWNVVALLSWHLSGDIVAMLPGNVPAVLLFHLPWYVPALLPGNIVALLPRNVVALLTGNTPALLPWHSVALLPGNI